MDELDHDQCLAVFEYSYTNITDFININAPACDSPPVPDGFLIFYDETKNMRFWIETNSRYVSEYFDCWQDALNDCLRFDFLHNNEIDGLTQENRDMVSKELAKQFKDIETKVRQSLELESINNGVSTND